MGFNITWDVGAIKHQLNRCSIEMNSAYNDGFSAWKCKEDLLELQYHLNELLENSPTFVGEEEFHKRKSKEKTWKLLNEKTN